MMTIGMLAFIRYVHRGSRFGACCGLMGAAFILDCTWWSF